MFFYGVTLIRSLFPKVALMGIIDITKKRYPKVAFFYFGMLVETGCY